MPDSGQAPGKLADFKAALRAAAQRAGLDPELALAMIGSAPADEIGDRQPQEIIASLQALIALAGTRQPGKPSIRLFNPEPAADGFGSEHSVLHIVNDDMPFLVDSVTGTLNRNDIRVHLVMHPVLPAEIGTAQSLMHVEIDRISAADAMELLQNEVLRALADVRAAVEDWQAMLHQVDATVAETKSSAVPTGEASRLEAIALLRRLKEDLFTFLGYREYRLATPLPVDNADSDDPMRHLETGGLEVVGGAGMGVLRDDSVQVFDGLRHLDLEGDAARRFVTAPDVLLIAKSSKVSTVHRPVLMDAIGIRRFDSDGRVTGMRLFVGLFTSVAYQLTPDQIPFLRRKVETVTERAKLPAKGHAGKALVHILNSYPRDELFQIETETLFQHCIGILHLQERQRTAVFLRHDPLDRFVSALVFVPREGYDSAVRQRVQRALEEGLNGRCSAYYTTLDDSPLARVLYVLRTARPYQPKLTGRALTDHIADAARAWRDRLQEALIARHGEEEGLRLFHRHRDAFPASYQERFTAAEACGDIDRIAEAGETGVLGIMLYRRDGAPADEVRLKLFSPDGQIRLSSIMPILSSFGMDVYAEMPMAIDLRTRHGTIWVHDLEADLPALNRADFIDTKALFEDALFRAWHSSIDVDGLNRLIVAAGLDWRRIVLVRAYVRFLKQARFPFDQEVIESALAAYPDIVADAVRLFYALFSPEPQTHDITDIESALDRALDAIPNLDDDRILRALVTLIRHTLRTNYFQLDEQGEAKDYLSLKFDSRALGDILPAPRPHKEIFVFSPRMEGIHLRGGPIARGGIRWSDRHQDFRTEILDLMKAQMVKNAVIVPVGAKGGFVLKQPPADREALRDEAVDCYKLLIRGLLDITDNVTGRGAEQKVMRPERVIARDGDDPYLVVAADKGTASFSDIANGLSADYGFWAGDAFASGGSAGYDHKAMGITARGAWESVKRHFRELGTDTQSEPFTVIGVGDMSGDVFGNGMLLSRFIRLQGAFNHLHIFCDPDPDIDASYAERERLFGLGRGSWDGYDETLLSPGGRIYSRADKSLKLTPEIRAWLAIDSDEISPDGLIRVMLGTPVDLLWFGGIGTYVKARSESDADVLDKANDALRLNAIEIGARVIGEGANLGVTQAGRIEFALHGGKINTDFIDNSAGVDSSDHEVNIKILLSAAIADGALAEGDRNALLEDMTEDVAGLVLRHNYEQTQALSIMERMGTGALEGQARLIRTLEQAGRIDRTLDVLPSDDDLRQRLSSGKPLTRPELSTLLTQAKNHAFDALIGGDLPDAESLHDQLVDYFPPQLRDRFRKQMPDHQLRREIIATRTANQLMDRVRPTFVLETLERTGADMANFARAFFVIRKVFDLPRLWAGIEALDNEIPAALQLDMFVLCGELLERLIPWLLLSPIQPLRMDIAIERYGPGTTALIERLDGLLPERRQAAMRTQIDALVERGIPADLAADLARLRPLFGALDIVDISDACGADLDDAARGYFAIGERFGLAPLRQQIRDFDFASYWDRAAAAALVEDMYLHQAALARHILSQTEGPDIMARVDYWMARHGAGIARLESLLREVESGRAGKLSVLTLVNRQLQMLVTG